MTPWIRDTKRTRTADSGMSLVELLVAMMLFALIMTIVTSLFVSATRTLAQAKAVTENTKMASNGMNESARVIRAGTENPVSGKALNDPAFVSALNEQVIIYAYVNLDTAAESPVMIRLSVNSNRQLVESRWPATALSNGNWSFPLVTTTPAAQRVLAGTVAPHVTGTPWLFSYLLADGSTLAQPATGTFTDTQLRTIAAVRITLTIQTSTTNSSRSVTLTNAVGMPNVGIPRSVP